MTEEIKLIFHTFGEKIILLYFIRITLFFFSIALVFAGCKKENIPGSQTFVVPAVEDIVMYEININAFSPAHDLQGIIDRLDSIKALGINTIWLMPTYPVGIVNSFGSPYCVRNYTEVNPNMGTLEDLQTLVGEAHNRNIAVILDWVANHTSWDNVWIGNDGWYSEDAAGNIISPPGTTWTDVADLNFNNADMRLAMIDAMKYWIENADIDGYRCDAADFVPFDFWQQAIDSLRTIEGKNLILLAEGARADHFTAGFQMNFSWSFLGMIKSIFTASTSANALFSTNTSEYSVVPPGDHKLRFITNHDESNISTPVTVYGGQEAALAASVITFYMEGVPLIYCGQEVGVSSSSVYSGSINWTINPDLLSKYKEFLNFYKTSDALRKGTLESFSNTNVAIFKKRYVGEQALVLVNTRSTSQTFDIPVTLQGHWTNAFSDSTITLSADLTLAPYEYFVLMN